MAGHTPGPWTVSELDGRVIGPVRTLVDTSSGTEVPQLQAVARVLDRIGDRLGEAKANARLIAAAPDLLEALQLVSLARTRGELCWCDVITLARSHEHSPACLAARAAIAKAEGR